MIERPRVLGKSASCQLAARAQMVQEMVRYDALRLGYVLEPVTKRCGEWLELHAEELK